MRSGSLGNCQLSTEDAVSKLKSVICHDSVAVVEHTETGTDSSKCLKINVYGADRHLVGRTLHKRLTTRIADQTLAAVVTELVVADAVAAYQIALILDGTGPCEHAPRLLAALRPVGHADDGIILPRPAVARPDGETEVVKRWCLS